jgi:hypothetical protein
MKLGAVTSACPLLRYNETFLIKAVNVGFAWLLLGRNERFLLRAGTWDLYGPL